MSLFTSIKKLVQGKNDSGAPTPASTMMPSSGKPSQSKYDTKPHHAGLHDQATSIHFDCVQRLCSVGFNDGTVKIFGLNAMECSFKCEANAPVLKVIFIINTPFLVVVTANSIEKWNYSERKVVNVLNFMNRITSLGLTFGCNFMYIGDETGHIQVYNIMSHFLSSYKITLDLVGLAPPQGDGTSTQPVYPSAIDICPVDPNLLLIGYSNGWIVSWNVECRKVEKKFGTFKSFVTKVVWSRTGSKFICGFFDGQIFMVDYAKQVPSLLYKPAVGGATGTAPATTGGQPERVSIDQLELVYTKDKKIILFKGHFQAPNSLVLVKGDSQREIQQMGVSQLVNGVVSFVPVLDTPFASVKELTGLLALTHRNEVVYFRFDTVMIPTPLDEINMKIMSQAQHEPLLAQCYECDIKLKDDLLDAFYANNTSRRLSPIVGGNVKHSRLFQLMITTHRDNSLRFWDFTDSRSYQLITMVEPLPSAPITMCFSPANRLLLLTLADGTVLVYSICGDSRRIQKTSYPAPVITEAPTVTPASVPAPATAPVQDTTTTQASPQKSVVPPETENEVVGSTSAANSPTVTSTTAPAPATRSPPISPPSSPQTAVAPALPPLPDPLGPGCQLVSEWKFPSAITAIALNPFRSQYCTRVVMASATGSLYHFVVTLVDNSSSVNTSRVVYTANIDVQACNESAVLDQDGKASPITALALCYCPIRSNEDISIFHVGTESGQVAVVDVHSLKVVSSFKASSSGIQDIYYIDKRGRQPQYIFVDLPLMHEPPVPTPPAVTVDQLVAAPIPSSPNANLTDDINILVASSKELTLYNVPLKNLSQYTPTASPQQDNNNNGNIDYSHPKINKEEFKTPVVKTSMFRDIGSDQHYLAAVDQSNHYHLFDMANTIDKQMTCPISEALKPAKLVCLTMAGNVFVQHADNAGNYTLLLQPHTQRHHYMFFQQTILTPPEPKVQSSLVKFLFGPSKPAPSKLEDAFAEGVTVNSGSGSSHSSASKQKVFVEDIANTMAETRRQMDERGEKINQLDVKAAEMQAASVSFAKMSADLKNANKSWF
ncbi:hypothetical protein SAMD00019534_117550 [Acytostelium subglobosum LB1]|uniref:hypothetical protein n=1 Tax=Acytostelium subglobosum LB1 TaxID=1410327 RepID=UPI000644BCCA|nr:hypothetical protein SAMD00019534_117550 [Acytostelium subglobosum LB1]GAM28579.1 hypothetical protein SAMD00019534_117550 [Acytostelium subglobosum LB1]|eukprot:XP_012748357.1 hypothetical protein SAMD00019534_117550 [Acytostelium subglobosum LB1]